MALAACLALTGCDSDKRRSPVGSSSAKPAPRLDRRVFFSDLLLKRMGKSRRSSKYFTLPPIAEPPFVLIVDYHVDWPGAVVVEIDGKELLRAPHFETDAGPTERTRRVQQQIELSVGEQHDILTSIASPGTGSAKLQLVGTLAEDSQ